MGRRRRSSSFKVFTVLLFLAVGGYRLWQGEWPLESQKQGTPAKATKVFEVLPNAQLHEDDGNDGDSFKLSHNGRVHHFRLYFADCPEKRRHKYNLERLADQGRYFSGLSESRTVALGLKAKERTETWLRTLRFTVYTKWHRVYDSNRFYAFVIFEDGEDLSQKLIREGLARIHTTGNALPDGTKRESFEAHLRRLEREARATNRGGWGMRR